MVKAIRAECTGPVLLKVIIETGELKEAAMIRRASELAIEAGADFIKTSTGKVAVNATLEAADIMDGQPQSGIAGDIEGPAIVGDAAHGLPVLAALPHHAGKPEITAF